MQDHHHHHHHDHDHAAHEHVSHGRDHGHHGHAHAPASFGAAFAIGTALNLGFVVIEVLFGIASNSVALLADASHNFGDGLGLLAAWTAALLGRRLPTVAYTYGFGKSSILAALFNGLLLMIAVGAIGWEAVQRFITPAPVVPATVMIVAAIGICVNGATALLFMSGRKGDLNVRAAFLHMVADAAVSAGVVASGLLILLTGWLWLDPAMSLVINAVILWGTWSLLRQSLSMVMAGVPEGTDLAEVKAFLGARRGVTEVHDLHIWPLSTTETALSCHVIMPAGHPGDAWLLQLCADLKERFGIGHPTIQIETDPNLACPFSPDHVV